MEAFKIISYITNHPLNRKNKFTALRRFARWQIGAKLNPYPIIYSFTDRSKLIVKKGMAGATGNLYCGLHEFEDMSFLLHFLRETDLFVDIGSNIGSYTILASAHVGADSISIEPAPVAYGHLLNNILINNMSAKVIPLNIGLGSERSQVSFTSTLDTTNHVATDSETDVINVNIDTLDQILYAQKVPSLIKIDVEGFETEVIKGAKTTLNDNQLKAIIIELNGSGGRYGYDEQSIHEVLKKAGFTPHTYDPFERRLTPLNSFDQHNTIYIRDIQFVEDRLKTADKVRILNTML